MTDGRGSPIRVEAVRCAFEGKAGPVVALDGVDLAIDAGEIFCLVGPSGCGKSTLLGLIAGLDFPDSGSVLVGGEPVRGPGPDRGVVFQQYALFPWMTVEQNVAFGLRQQGVPREERRAIAARYIDLVGLSGFATAHPKELSGGMRQRTALARAYAVRPRVLLMDEPFGALDSMTRGTLQEELLRTWESESPTILFITHDVEEAVFLGHRVGIMTTRPGRIRETVEVDLPFPREERLKLTGEFLETKRRVWSIVEEEYGRGKRRSS